jgi:hypothetical protein
VVLRLIYQKYITPSLLLNNGVVSVRVTTGRRLEIIDTVLKKCSGYYKIVDDKGRNMLHCAVEHNSYGMVRHICQKYAIDTLLNGTEYEGNTPLHV